MRKSLGAVLLLSGLLSAVGFKPVGYFDNGVEGRRPSIPVFDSNHDGRAEIVFLGKHQLGEPFRTVFYGYTSWNRYACVDSFVGQRAVLPRAIGYLDDDSLVDLVANAVCSLAVFESPAVDSYPKKMVWFAPGRPDSNTYGSSQTADLDCDGRKDILTVESGRLWMIENVSDNQYEKVWYDTLLYCQILSPSADFDQDGRKEFASSGINGVPFGPSLEVYECTGDNQFQRVFVDTLTSVNNFDLTTTSDLDGDGRPEFIVGGNNRASNGSWTGQLWIYEAIGNNDYDIILHDSLTNLPGDNAYYPKSSSGDVDGDGQEELIWAVKNNWMIYKATGNNTFERVFTAWEYGNGHGTTNTLVHDMNKNGYPEIIESGEGRIPGHETFIWEIEGVKLHQPNGLEVLVPGSQFPITWEKLSPPGADSFTLFVSFNNGIDYQTIGTIRQSDDTLYAWSVPDTLADSCKIMIWAYGPPRAGQNTPRGTAWDFSDTVFAIRQTAVGEDARSTMHDTRLKILQNPTTRAKGIRLLASCSSPSARLQIYDVAGKLVQSFVLNSMPFAQCSITLRLSPGIYFIRLDMEGKVITRKAVVLE